MIWSERVAVVIPCLNEGTRINGLVREVRRFLSAIIVVDDGSNDGTASEARKAGAEVLSHRSTRGKGAALGTGFSAALSDGYEWALAMDGDGQHAPSDIPAFTARAEQTPAAMLIGNRMENCRGMPAPRRFVNRWMSRELGKFCRARLPDSQCGFRMVHLASWERLTFLADHFEIESELIVRFLRAGLAIDFVPVQTRYGAEQSKIRPLRDTVRWCRWWIAIRKEMAAMKAPGARREPRFVSTPQDATA